MIAPQIVQRTKHCSSFSVRLERRQVKGLATRKVSPRRLQQDRMHLAEAATTPSDPRVRADTREMDIATPEIHLSRRGSDGRLPGRRINNFFVSDRSERRWFAFYLSLGPITSALLMTLFTLPLVKCLHNQTGHISPTPRELRRHAVLSQFLQLINLSRF